MHPDIVQLAERLGAAAAKSKIKITAAESCTGGGVAHAITGVAGSSAWFEYGFVTYSNAAKGRLLEVKPQLLLKHGAVSQQVVSAMAEGALKKAGAHYAVAVSGVAGPGGGSAEKPVGLVWFAWVGRGHSPVCARHIFKGSREDVRDAAIALSLSTLCEMVENTTV